MAQNVDPRNVMSGKDGMLYDLQGNALAGTDTFTAQANFESQTFQPLGSMMKRSVPTAYDVKINITEIVIKSGLFFRDMMEGLKTGKMPVYHFRGSMINPYDGSEESVVYRDCVLDGSVDIQNMTVNELYKRNWSLICNNPPDLQKYM